jgi:anti-anti-sigma regulatory factor
MHGMADFSVRIVALPEEEGAVVVRVAGPTRTTDVSALLMELLAAFEQTDKVVLDLGGVTEIDAAGLQLLCSSHRSSLFIDKGFRITGQDQPAIREAAAAAGRLRTSGCAIDSYHTCVWTGGNC